MYLVQLFSLIIFIQLLYYSSDILVKFNFFYRYYVYKHSIYIKIIHLYTNEKIFESSKNN